MLMVATLHSTLHHGSSLTQKIRKEASQESVKVLLDLNMPLNVPLNNYDSKFVPILSEVQVTSGPTASQQVVTTSSTGHSIEDKESGHRLLKQPDHEIFHAMISYRVITDADFARAIHDRLHFKALNAKKKLDFYAAAKYPSAFNRASDTKQSWINIFLDKVCLQTGKDWADEGFILALLQSLSFIPILSWSDSSNVGPSTGSIGQLAQHHANSPIDNVLLELVLAKELHSSWQKISKKLNLSDVVVFPCMHIVPIFMQNCFSKLSLLSEDVPVATLKKAEEVLRSAGHPTSASFMQQSVKDVVTYFTKLQGIKHYELGNPDVAIEQVANRLWEILKTQAKDFDIDRFQLSSFAQYNPHGSELIDFLSEIDSSYLSRFLIKHNVSSVASLAGLKEIESSVLGLAQETSKACKRPIIEEALKIKRAINEAAASELSLPLKKRLTNFVDREASVLTAMYSSSACDIMLSKSIFRFVMISIGIIAIVVGINSFLDLGLSGSALVLFWTGTLMSAGAVVAIFSAPRYGRYLFSLLFIGDMIIHSSIFAASCIQNRSVLSANDSSLLISSKALGEFGRLYQFLAQLLFFAAMFYTITFRQRYAWACMMIFLAHYMIFLIIMNLTMLRPPSQLNFAIHGFVAVGCTVLFLITEVAKRLGTVKAQKSVLKDLQSRQTQWSEMISNPSERQKFDRIESLLQSGGLSAICEQLSRKQNLVPIRVVQQHNDIDKLFRDCTVLNFFFQDWVRLWFTSGGAKDEFEYCNPKSQFNEIFKLHFNDCTCEVLRGPIKSPKRTISKVLLFFINFLLDLISFQFYCAQIGSLCQIYRSYSGQVEHVTDLVRCAIVFSEVGDLLRFLEVSKMLFAEKNYTIGAEPFSFSTPH
jgi:hypothetical protein